MSRTILTDDNIKQIALEYAIKGPKVLGMELGVSKQRIQQLAYKLRKFGLKIPHIRRGSQNSRNYTVIVQELKAEHPEL